MGVLLLKRGYSRLQLCLCFGESSPLTCETLSVAMSALLTKGQRRRLIEGAIKAVLRRFAQL